MAQGRHRNNCEKFVTGNGNSRQLIKDGSLAINPSQAVNPAQLLRRAAEKVAASGMDLQAIIDKLPMGFILLEKREDGYYCIHANQYFLDFFSLSAVDLISNPLHLVEHLRDSSLIDQCDLVCESLTPTRFEWQYSRPIEELFLSCHIIPVQGGEGENIRLLGTVTDRSAEKRAEKRLLHNALYDGLTGLPNRSLFQEQLNSALERRIRKSTDTHLAVFVMNVDRFQLINETLGHTAGDEFLIAVASRLKKESAEFGYVARLSGDEFAVFARNVRTISKAKKLAHRIHKVMELPFQLGDAEFHASITIGIATTHSSQPHSADLIRDADFAMHRAKKSGHGRCEVFARDTHQHARTRFHLEIDLRKAIRDQELQLYYQPILDLGTSELTGFEALARWNHKTKGFISPAEFIPIAEESGLIVDIGQWALIEAARQLRRWQKAIPFANDLTISVNVSGVQFQNSNVVSDVWTAVQDAGIKSEQFILELTESSLIDNPEHTISILSEMRDLGVHVALDDFGTGYSSLSYLQKFPLSILKIDRSFVMEMESGESSGHKIVELITLLAQALDLSVIAEGIETIEHRDALLALGCTKGQGFLFSRPVPATEAAKLIKSRNLAPSVAA